MTFTLTGNAANPNSITALTVTANGLTLSPYTDYTLSGSDITFTASPVASGGKIYVEVARAAVELKFTGDGSTAAFTLTGDSAAATSIYALKIVVDGILQIPFRDFTFASQVVTFTTTPIDTAGITIYQKSYFEYVDAFTAADSSVGDSFGASLSWTTDGRRLVVGCPNDNHSGKTGAGSVYIYDRTAVEFVGDGATTTFSANVQTLFTKVFVNGNIQSIELGDGKGDYELTSGDIVFAEAPAAGSIISIENNYFFQTAKLLSNSPETSAKLGTSVTICPYSCSVYSGAPYSDGTNDKDNTGSVIRWVNQGRSYGSITGSTTTPVVAPAGYLIINDRWVYIANNSTLDEVVDDINLAEIPGVVASNVGDALKIVSNSDVAADKLKVTASATTVLDDLGLTIYPYQQTISSPDNEEFSNFGKELSISPDAMTLVVATDKATSYLPVTFDNGDTTFDRTMTSIVDTASNSGAVFTYQYIPRPDDSIDNPGSFIPAQRLTADGINYMDQFGASVIATNDAVFVGAPGDDTYSNNGGLVFSFKLDKYERAWTLTRSESAKTNINLINRVNLIDTKKNEIITNLDFIDPYKGKISGIAAQEIAYRASYDPAVYNIANDQLTKTTGVTWGTEQVGSLWWNTSQTRWMEYEQGSIEFRTANWGTAFPKSTIYCFEWTESSVPPSQYSDSNNQYAFVLQGSRYARSEFIDDNGNVQVRYYFWVGGKTSVPAVPNRSISAVDVENLIANPKSAGIPYAAFVGPNAIALYNCKQFLRDKDVVLNIDYDVEENEDNIHAEYQLVSQGDPNSKPTDTIITKMIDSLSGSDLDGRLVPDIYLSEGRKYGKEFRPRQTMFKNRTAALNTAVDYINSVLASHPVLLDKDTTRLLAKDPVPYADSGDWDESVADLTELNYLLINILPIGHAVLVQADSTIKNRWAIYKVAYLENGFTKYWKLYKLQSYANRDYLNEIDWVKPNTVNPTQTDYVLNFNYQLVEIAATSGTTVKVKDDGRGYYTIYEYTAANQWEPIVREKATIEIVEKIWNQSLTLQGFGREGFDLQPFDDWANIEIQNIIRAVYEDIFTVDLAIEKNNWFFIMVQQLLQEQSYVDWIFKSSFIRVSQHQRAISQIPSYQKDNQDLLVEYINEVKPYHTKIREYVINYDGDELTNTESTDFDVPSYYLSATGKYRSPNGSETIDSFILDLAPYTAWRDNHAFEVDSIEVVYGGTNYSAAPTITISGGGGTGATAVANILNGEVVTVTVTNSGSGYTSNPTITLSENSGDNAVLAVRIANNKIRKFAQTIKFDRISTPNAGFLIEFKDLSGNQVDITSERISRLVSAAGVIDYVLDIVSQDVVSYDGVTAGDWLVDSLTLAGYPVASIPNYRFFPDNSGRIQLLYQKKPQGWTAASLEAAIQALGTSVGANGLDVSNTTVTLDGSMTSYTPSTFEWAANTSYEENDIIAYNNQAYRAVTDFTTVDNFADDYLELIAAEDFESHLDRTWVYYQPKSGQFGKDLGQLFSGIEYPGVNVAGASFSMEPGFDVGNYDIDSFDTFVIGPEGVKVLDPAVLDQTLYSQFTDTALGTRPEDINTFGGSFVSAYSSHAPEEMIPGRVYDTLDIKVYSTPSDDWTGSGELALGIVLTTVAVGSTRTFSYIAPLNQADVLVVFTIQTGRLIEGVDYTANRVNKTITVSRILVDTDSVLIYAMDNGGPGLVFAAQYLTDGEQTVWDIPVDRNRITQVYATVDGVLTSGWDLGPATYTSGVSTVTSTVTFDTAPAAGKTLFLHAFYSTSSNQALTEVHNTSRTLTGGTYPLDYTINLDRSVGYDYPLADKIIVEINGGRLRPPSQTYYTGDGSSTTFQLPITLYVDPDDVSDNEIVVAVDGVHNLVNVDWTLDTSDGSTIRSIVFNSAPDVDAEIVISHTKDAGYQLVDSDSILINELLVLNTNDKINVLTFKNHDKIKMRTEVFQGSSLSSTTVAIGFDDVGYDTTAFEGTSTTISTVTQYTLSRPVGNTSYLWVTLDTDGSGFGQRLNPNVDYRMISDTVIELGTGLGINPDSIIVVTSFGEKTQKPSVGFRIFKDLNDNFDYYRISRDSITNIAQEVNINDTLIYVDDASALPEPNPSKAIPGVIMLGGEMIHYYTRDLTNNTIGQLRRGVNGTSIIQTVPVGTSIIDTSLDHKIPNAHNKIWYDTGVGTASNGLGLQYSTTEQAQFLLSKPTLLESDVF